ncbi:MAG: glycerophosphodiester phosphodiesterase family protein [Candidatus Liptonbacteria bacterium]|nr:glycerophosphodiester phosphodiesterase family protein [Candidatus Liptonbacteria bacterium]
MQRSVGARAFAVAVLILVVVFSASCLHARLSAGADNANTREVSLIERLRGPRAGAHGGNVFSLKFDTMAGFEKAKVAGADIVELDLRVSGEGIPVVYHDAELSSRTNCRGYVSGLRLNEIQRCRFRLNREHIPTFEEALRWSKGSIVVNAEFKEDAAIAPAVALIKQHDAYEWVYFQVKNWEQYKIARSIDAGVALLLTPADGNDLDKILSLQDDRVLVIELNQTTRTKENIDRIHAHGKFASEDVWHFVKTYELFGAACTYAFDLGIDIAITNRALSCAKQRDAKKYSPR